MHQFRLLSRDFVWTLSGYDPAVRGDVVNVFATAAFRFGHSEIPDMLRFSSKLFDVYEEMHLSKVCTFYP